MGSGDEEEVKNFIKVWILASTCLVYCYYVSSKIPKGILRLLSVLPVLYLFILLPLKLTSFHLGAPTSFFLVWLANFKLLLFSFDQGPLLSPPPQNVLHFISLACLPIKLRKPSHNPNFSNPTMSSIFHKFGISVIKILVLALIIYSYKYRNSMHPFVVLGLYCLNLYLELELILVIGATPARALFGVEMEPQFNEPYLATSLQDFWGRRWNLMVTSILRPTVYYPIRKNMKRVFGSKWASLPAYVATFAVSGLMHEVIYLYITRVRPTWEVTLFFVLHGFLVAAEVWIKKAVVKDRWRLPPLVSAPLTLVLVAVTGVWLFFPQLMRNGVDDKVIGEYSKLIDVLTEKINYSFTI